MGTTGPCQYGDPHGQQEFARILLNMNAQSIAFGICLIVGSIISTIPQHVKIWQTRSSAGLSFLWLFLGNINQFSSVVNAVLLKFPQETACVVLGLGRCLPSLLSLIQLIGLWLFTFPLYIWYLKFADPRGTPKKELFWAKVFFGVLLVYFLSLAAVGTVMIMVLGECHSVTITFGYSLGLLSTIVTFVQWSPQLYSTFKRKSVGSFSILMLCIQCPGSVLIVYFLVFISKESISTWLSYLSALVQQFILLLLLVYYDRKVKNSQKTLSLNSEESESLLINGVVDNNSAKYA